jgi:hypothetical protein
MFVKKKIQEYVGKTWYRNHAGEMHMLMMPVLAPPASATEKAIWKKKIELYIQREMALEENNRALYALVPRQCTKTMRAKIEAQPTFDDVYRTLNGLNLPLVMINDLVYQFRSQKYLPHSIHEAMRRLVTFQQGKGVPAATYLEQFQNLVNVATYTGESAGLHAGY